MKPELHDPKWLRLCSHVQRICDRVRRDQWRINNGEPLDARLSGKYV